MAKVLIIGEIKKGELKGSVGELVAAARMLGDDIHGALVGKGSEAVAAGFGAYGISTVYTLDGDLPVYSSDGFASALAPMIGEQGFDYIVMMQSFFGRDLGARLAAKLNAGWICDVTKLEVDGGNVVATKPLYAGKILGKASFTAGGPRIITIRPKNFTPVEAADGTASTVALGAPAAMLSKVTNVEEKAEGMIDLKEADIIVSGGRATDGPEGFVPLREFAMAIGAALGASRAAVDSGWIDHSHQVGQTGKVVNPQLYIACGISGMIQHLAGMQTSKVIVAINNNENAPIFKVATYGIVDDMFKVVPVLKEKMAEAMKG